jgi:hypothetical protein
LGTVRFGRSDRLGFPQGAHRGEKGGAGGHEGVGCVDTHLHLTRIFLPRRSLSTTSIMRAVAYPDGAYDAWKEWPRGWPPPLFVINFPEISTEPIAKRSSQRSGSATSSARDHHADPKRPAAHRAAPRVPPGRPRAGDRVVQSDIRVPQQVRARPPAGVIPVKNAPIQSGVQPTTTRRLTHHSHPSPSLSNFTGTPGTCARSSRPRRNPTARASWTPPTARHAAASPWRSARPTAR